jgi:hypothetical protein
MNIDEAQARYDNELPSEDARCLICEEISFTLEEVILNEKEMLVCEYCIDKLTTDQQ